MPSGSTTPVDPQYQPLAVEERILEFWRKTGAFEKLRQLRAGKPEFRFLDGPITANNPMGVHHAWGRTLKDAAIRYRAMRDQSCRYQNGFDCQGLWVEVEVERALGLEGKPDIESFGVAEFSRACRERVNTYAAVISEQSTRLGQWMDWDHSYFTFDDTNITAIWHFLKTCHERGIVYRGHLPLPWCTRCGTSLSQHEMMGSYVNALQPAVYVTAPLRDGSGRALVMWTTTPWTLAANTAAAVHPEMRYVEVVTPEGVLVMSEASRRRLGYEESDVRTTVDGSSLVGLEFDTYFPDLPVQAEVPHRVVAWTEIDPEEGSGIAHIAPGCGPEDFELARENGLAIIAPIDDRGRYLDGLGWLTGRDVPEVTDDVLAALRANGRLLRDEMYEHSVPVCWRCKSHVVFRLVDEWFLAADPVREPMIDAAAQVAWQPDYIGKRMEDWLRNMGDWNISRKRYWGLPLPFYPCGGCATLTVVGSLAELRERAVHPALVDALPELHKPWIDDVDIVCPHCAATVSRVPEVGDCWLDAGITPYSTLGYFDDPNGWAARFPVEWICEMREQVRLWFYSMLFMSVVLRGRAPYERVLGHERVLSESGEKFSKTGFMIRFDDAVSTMGADAVRYIFSRQPPGTECRFGSGAGEEARRRLAGLWNIQSFFLTYANLDRPTIVDPATVADLYVTDRWLLARTDQLVIVASAAMEAANTPAALVEVEQYLDQVSNWYVRVNRRRFWTGSASEKRAAYATLHAALRTVTLVLAPIVPFVTEQVWQNAVRPFRSDAPESVHHEMWPTDWERWRDAELIERTALVRGVVRSALRLRDEAHLRVRQPLSAVYVVGDAATRQALKEQRATLLAELNVKDVVFLDDLSSLQYDALALDFRRAGPLLRREVGAVSDLVRTVDEETQIAVVDAVRSERPVRLPGWSTDLPPEIFAFERVPRPGFLFGEQRPGEPTLVLDVRLTEELTAEGTARDVLRHVQVLRRDSGLEVSTRIALDLRTDSAEVQAAIDRFVETIRRDVLADERLVDREGAHATRTVGVAGSDVEIALRPLG